MKYGEIEAFLSIIRHGNLSNAAKSLYISQSTLSQRLKSLENDLKVTLIKRTKGKDTITLTHFGEKFYKIAEKFERLESEAKEIMLEQEDTLSIGAVDSIHNYLLPSIYQNLINRDINIRVILKTYQSNEIYQLVENQEIDIGFPLMERVNNNLNVLKLLEEKMVLIMKRNDQTKNKLIHNSTLDPKHELYTNWSPEFRSWHEKWWGIEGSIGIQIDTGALLLQFILHEHHWAIVPFSMAIKFREVIDIEIYSLYDAPPSRTCYAIYRKDSERSHIIEDKLLNMIKPIQEEEIILSPTKI